MAKRKRLNLNGLGLETKARDPGQMPPSTGGASSPLPSAIPGPMRAAPIAQVAGDSSAQAALSALTAELEEARASGRLMRRLELEQITADHMARDRMRADPQDMTDLIVSLRDRGQQVPIEVQALEDGRFGLISGWRRLAALRHLYEETGEPRFATVLAILRAPETLAEAYRAMVEENEIRAGISYYERARIAALAAEAGIYADARAAISGLFAAGSRAKRSKIGSFLLLWQTLDSRLRFGPAIPERLGLALARAIEDDAGFARRLSDRLRKATCQSAADELALLERALRKPAASDSPPDSLSAPRNRAAAEGRQADASVNPALPLPASAHPAAAPHIEEIRPGVMLETTCGFSAARLVLSGKAVDGALRDRLVAWLRAQG